MENVHLELAGIGRGDAEAFFTSYEGHDMAAQEAVKHSETNIHICINNQADTRKEKGTSIEMHHP